MNQRPYKKRFVIGAVAAGVIAGVAVGFFTAHRTNGRHERGMDDEGGGL